MTTPTPVSDELSDAEVEALRQLFQREVWVRRDLPRSFVEVCERVDATVRALAAERRARQQADALEGAEAVVRELVAELTEAASVSWPKRRERADALLALLRTNAEAAEHVKSLHQAQAADWKVIERHREDLRRVALAAMSHRRGTPMHVTDEDALNGTISYRGLDLDAILAEPRS